MSSDQPAGGRASGSRWASWRSLSPYERRATVLAALLIPTAAVALRLFGAARTLKVLGVSASGATGSGTQSRLREARGLAYAVARAGRHSLYSGNCFSQSVALLWLLRRRGLAGVLRLGGRTRAGQFEAHAWVEHGETVLNDAADVEQRFSPFNAAPTQTVPDLLLAAVHGDGKRFNAFAVSRISEGQWRELATFATRQRVRPLLWRRLQAVDVNARVPRAVLDRLDRECRRILLRNLKTLGEVGRVVRLLDDIGVPALLLKGVYLGPEVYGSAGLREMIDVDIMVRRQHLDKAFDALRRVGYVPYAGAAISAETKKHAPSLYKAGHTAVEIHWAIAAPPFSHSCDPEELWTRAVPVTIGASRAWALSPDDLLLHLCLHASYQHHFDLGLRPFCDIAALLDRSGALIDWATVQQRACTWDCRKGTYLTLRLAAELVGANVPASVLSSLRPADMDDQVVNVARAEVLSPHPTESLPWNVARLVAHEPVLQRLRHLRRRMFLSDADIVRAYGELPRSRRAVERWLRPAFLMKRYGVTAFRLLVTRSARETEMAARRNAIREWMNA